MARREFHLDELEVEIVVADDMVDKAVGAIAEAANTGRIGDGKIFVLPVDDAMRIRTGETDEEAV